MKVILYICLILINMKKPRVFLPDAFLYSSFHSYPLDVARRKLQLSTMLCDNHKYDG